MVFSFKVVENYVANFVDKWTQVLSGCKAINMVSYRVWRHVRSSFISLSLVAFLW